MEKQRRRATQTKLLSLFDKLENQKKSWKKLFSSVSARADSFMQCRRFFQLHKQVKYATSVLNAVDIK